MDLTTGVKSGLVVLFITLLLYAMLKLGGMGKISIPKVVFLILVTFLLALELLSMLSR